MDDRKPLKIHTCIMYIIEGSGEEQNTWKWKQNPIREGTSWNKQPPPHGAASLHTRGNSSDEDLYDVTFLLLFLTVLSAFSGTFLVFFQPVRWCYSRLLVPLSFLILSFLLWEDFHLFLSKTSLRSRKYLEINYHENASCQNLYLLLNWDLGNYTRKCLYQNMT